LAHQVGIDAVREFNVLSDTYSAEYGKRAGAQVTVVTQSGSNQLHGSLFEFLRNSALDARNTFDLGFVPPFRRNQFGGALGGPVKKDRLFLVVALGHAHIDLKSLHKRLGADRLSFGRPELLMEVLGVPAGSVTPFALINDQARRVTVILDADMMRHERLNYHPLENTATTNIARDDLVAFIRACGHEPRILAVAESAGAP